MNLHQWRQQVHNFNESFKKNTEVTDQWSRNVAINLPRFNKKNTIWNLIDLYSGEKEKVAILVGASPSLIDDIEKLKEIDDNFFIICANSALKTLLKYGVKPKFCICLDGDMVDIPQHLDCDNKDITLLAGSIIAPEALDKWKGPVYFLPHYSIDKKLRSRVRRRLGKSMIAGGNSISEALYISAVIFDCKTIIFVGNEFCFDKNYYADPETAKSETIAALFPTIDSKGRNRCTIPALYTYAMWIDKICGDLSPPGFFIDTSFGLLSTTNKAIHTMELSEAIKRVKWAMEKKSELNAMKSAKKRMELIHELTPKEIVIPDIYRYNYSDHREKIMELANMKAHN